MQRRFYLRETFATTHGFVRQQGVAWRLGDLRVQPRIPNFTRSNWLGLINETGVYLPAAPNRYYWRSRAWQYWPRETFNSPAFFEELLLRLPPHNFELLYLSWHCTLQGSQPDRTLVCDVEMLYPVDDAGKTIRDVDPAYYQLRNAAWLQNFRKVACPPKV